jgi:hypothetical protein
MTRRYVCVVFGPLRGKKKVFSIHRSWEHVAPLCSLVERCFGLKPKGPTYTYDPYANRPLNAVPVPGFELSRIGKLCVGVPPKPEIKVGERRT